MKTVASTQSRRLFLDQYQLLLYILWYDTTTVYDYTLHDVVFYSTVINGVGVSLPLCFFFIEMRFLYGLKSCNSLPLHDFIQMVIPCQFNLQEAKLVST